MSQTAEATTPDHPARHILQRCDELAKLTDEPGRITRAFLSPAMQTAVERVAGWMEQAGLRTELDTAGNLIGTYPCKLEDPPVLVLGSHLDTVRDAGRYDGVLGVLLALALAEKLDGASLPFELQVVAFADEEGLRYNVPFLGSQAMIGELDPTFLDRCDEQGVSMADAIRSWGGDPTAMTCRYAGRRTLGYLEAHIEQGPWLEHHDLPLGILEAISGSCWARLRFTGRADHAGTTPMELRKDALGAAAEAVLAVEQLGREVEGLVATVGQLEVRPGASNVIPAEVELSLDVRHPDSQTLAKTSAELLGRCHGIADRRGLDMEHQLLHRQDGMPADPGLSKLLADAARAAGHATGSLVVGAGHDALIMARRMPTAMLLLRSPGGISHHPDESVLADDVAAALEVMEGFVRRLAILEADPEQRHGWRLGPLDGTTETSKPMGVELDG